MIPRIFTSIAKGSLALFMALILVIGYSRVVQAQEPANFPNCRLGIDGITSDAQGYDIEQMNIGRYLDWRSRSTPVPGLPAGVEYIQSVRVHQLKECGTHCIGDYVEPHTYTVSPNFNTLASRAAAMPGSLWLIGNEVERRDFEGGGQDEILPELYATAFHEIRAAILAADPTARIGAGSIVQPTLLRFKYMDRLWDSYESQYGYPMGNDVDVWNIHLYPAREVRGSWGADIPAGLEEDVDYVKEEGFLYGASTQEALDAHHDMAYFQQFTEDFRAWMADKGERNKPLINTEYGVLLASLGISTGEIITFMEATHDYMLAATDNSTGYPADENRLVQSWFWYSLNDYDGSIYKHGRLFDPDNKSITTVGTAWKDYVTDAAHPLASEPSQNLLVWNLRTDPPQPMAPAGVPVPVTLMADIANSGNSKTDTGNAVAVSFWDGLPNAPGSSQIGSTQILDDIPGCGQFTTAQVTWQQGAGSHDWYVKVDLLGSETITDDNQANSTLIINEGGSAADLEVTLADAPDPVTQGDSLTYTITLTNHGPDPASVTLTSELPGQSTFGSDTPSQGSCSENSGVVTCQLGSLANGAQATVAVIVTPTVAGTLNTTASVTSDADVDPVTTNNTATESSTIEPPPSPGSLQFSQAAFNVSEGQPQATISILRTGGSGGTVSVDYATTGGSATPGSDYTAVTDALAWADGETGSKSFTVPISDDDIVEADETVSLALSNPTGGALLGSPNSATLTIASNDVYVPQADLSVTITDFPDPVTVGQTLTYSLIVSNAGPDAASNVVLVDTLFGSATIAQVVPNSGSCATGADTVTCTLAALAVDAVVTVTLRVTPTAEGELSTSATVSADEGDPVSENNSADETTSVLATRLRFSSANYSANEGSLSATIAVLRTGGSGGAVSIDYATTGGSATPGSDYTAVSGSLTWADGETGSKSFTVSITDDTVVESDETVGLALSNPAGGALLGSPNSATLTIASNDVYVPQADLSVTITDFPDPVTVGQTLTYSLIVSNAGPDAASNVRLVNTLFGTVDIAGVAPDSGSCTVGSDAVTCTIASLAVDAVTTVTLRLTPTAEGDLSVSAAVSADEGDPVSDNNSADETTSVLATRLRFSSLNYSANESSLSATIAVQRTGGSGGAVSVDYATSGGTATPGSDFTAVSGTLTWADGELGSKSFTVPITDDAAIEANETVALALSNPTGGALLGSPGNATLTIASNDVYVPQADLSVTITDFPDPVTVGQTLTYSLIVSNAGPDAASNVVLVDTLFGSATIAQVVPNSGSCATGADTVTCTLAALAVDAVVTVTLRVTPTAEGELSTSATVSADEGDPVSENNSADETTSVLATRLRFSSANYSANEGSLSATIAVLRTGGSGGAVSIDYATTGGSATPGSDYTAVSGSLTWADGETGSKSFTVPITDDAAIEANETVALALSNPTGGALLGSPNSATLTIASDDVYVPQADLSVAIADLPNPVTVGQPLTYSLVISNAGPDAASNVRLVNALFGDVDIARVVPNSGSCTVGSDTVTCTIASLAVNAATLVTLHLTPTAEGELNTSTSVSADEGDPVSENNSATESTTVLATRLRFSSAGYSVNESGLSASISILRTGGSGGAVSVDYATTGGSATPGSDYTAANGTLAWTDGETGSKSFTVPITDDLEIEANETVGLALSNPTGGALLGSPNSATLTIASNDVYVPQADLSVTITDFPDPVTVGQPLTYSLVISNAGPDLASNVVLVDTLFGSTTIAQVVPDSGSCATGADTVTCTLAALPVDAVVTVTLRVTPTAEGELIISANVTADEIDPESTNNSTLENTDVAPLPPPGSLQFSASSYAVSEAESQALITVTRTSGSWGPVSVSYFSRDSSAIENSDYIPVSGVLSWADNDTSPKIFTVTIVPDNTFEPNESLLLELHNPAGGAGLVTPKVATLMISNDDAAPAPEQQADLSVSQTYAPSTVFLGQPLTYTIIVTNHGPGEATGVVLTDTLSAQTIFDVTTSAQSVCTIINPVVCQLGTLTTGQIVTVTLVVTPTALITLSNIITITANESDPVAENNRTAESIMPHHQPNADQRRIYLPIISKQQ